MTGMQRQVKRAQRRLWLNRWFSHFGWCVMIAAGAWTLTLVADRLFALGWPIPAAALAALGVALLSSTLWLVLSHEEPLDAAAALDQAAGLRERVSTGLEIQTESKDPFEHAVLADAERVTAGMTPTKFLPLRWAPSLTWGGVAVVVALLSLLLPEFDILKRAQASADQLALQQRQQIVRTVMARPVSVMQDIAEKNPDLAVREDINRLNDLKDRKDSDPDFKRREAVKQINRLQDALKQKADEERFRSMKETKKRLRQVGRQSDPKSELSELIENLSEGDFEEAEKTIKKLQEKLAQRAKAGKLDPEKLKEMQKQMQQLAKKLQEAGQDQESRQEMQNAGLNKEEMERVLNALAKKDPQQLEKLAKELSQRLKEQGVSEEQLKQMMQKIQQRQQACKQCNKMGQKMGQAAKSMEKGEMQQAQQQLGEAGEMLNEMEQLEQALNDLESQMAQLDEAQQDLDELDESREKTGCEHCNGTGFRPDGAPCPHCNRVGQGGGAGQAWGFRDRDDNVDTATKNEKAKIKQGRGGSIIGQQFVKGKQLKGESAVDFEEAVRAGEIERTDAIDRPRIPPRYRKGVTRFLDRIRNDGSSIIEDDTKANDKAKAADKSSAAVKQ